MPQALAAASPCCREDSIQVHFIPILRVSGSLCRFLWGGAAALAQERSQQGDAGATPATRYGTLSLSNRP